MSDNTAQWELSKENILPMKSGRDVAVLNEALGEQKANWKEQRLKEWRSFQDRLVANESSKDALLNTYYELLCWLENTFPQGGKKYIKLNAKRCFHKLKDDKSFYDNWKFMKVMTKYIEASGESCRYISEDNYCDLYNYMYINRIGTTYADFFISWANALEASESYAQASTVFGMGLKMGAEPRRLLEKEKGAFEDRMAVRAIEEMMSGEEGKLNQNERRQPLSSQESLAKRSAVAQEDSVIRVKSTSNAPSKKHPQQSNGRFSVHTSDPVTRPGAIGAAFTAVHAPPASNVVPTKHVADKENQQKAEQWAKPTKIPHKPSGQRQNKKSNLSSTFQVYSDESEVERCEQNSTKGTIRLGQPALRVRKDDEDADDILGTTTSQKSTIKSGVKESTDATVKFMFCEEALMSGPFGEMSFEELRANHILSADLANAENAASSVTEIPALAMKGFKEDDSEMDGFLVKDDDDDSWDHRKTVPENEADLTMALNAEVSRRELSNTDRQILGKTAFADSMMLPCGDSAEDSWSPAPNANQTAESVRLSHSISEVEGSMLQSSQTANQTNKLSVTQFDCLNRILSEAFRGPSQASSVAPPFAGNSEDTIGEGENVNSMSRAPSARSLQTGASSFVAFEDSMNSSALTKPEIPKADFFAYEDSFAQGTSNNASQPKKQIALRPHEQTDFVMYEDSFAGQTDAEEKSKKNVLRIAEPEPEFQMFEDSSVASNIQSQKRLALQNCSDETISDSDDRNNQQSTGESPLQKRSKPNSNSGNGMFSEGLTDCSDIVGDFTLCDGPGATGGNRFSLSTTIDFNPQNSQPKFCSTQYIDYNLVNSEKNNEEHDGTLEEEENFPVTRPPASRNSLNGRTGLKRQSITARVSTMPTLSERSESSSSGGSTLMGMHSALHTVRDSGLSAILESNKSNVSMDQPPPPVLDESDESLPTMNCELQKSYHTIDVKKFMVYSQLQQSIAFADKTYSCLREIDPTDPFSDELVERFVKRYGPSLKQLPNYIEVPNTKMPEFFGSNSRQSAVGKVIQLTPNFSVAYAFKVGAGAYAAVVGARDVETRKLYALKFQRPACKWEFYVIHELRERLKRKVNIPSVLSGILDIDRAFIYNNGSCYAMQHVRYGPLLNLVNKAREHTIELSEAVAVYITIELLRLIESIHHCHIIHADLKPDNVLFLGLPELPKLTRNENSEQLIFPPRQASIRVIDFGRSIDMTMFPPDTVFMAKVATSGFDCIEMRTDRPWTYQTDYFGLAGTVHVLVFQEYMRVSWRDDPDRDGRWWISRKYKRWWHHNDLWERLFDELLNIPDCDHQPDIKSLREAFEARFFEKMLSSYMMSQSSIMVRMKEFYHAN